MSQRLVTKRSLVMRDLLGLTLILTSVTTEFGLHSVRSLTLYIKA